MAEVSFEGDCFEAAGRRIIAEMMANKQLGQQFTLCHGIVTGQGPIAGRRITHGWIEFGDVVFDDSNHESIVMRKEIYYKTGNINEEDVVRYPAKEAILKMHKTQTYGPWHPKFKNID